MHSLTELVEDTESKLATVFQAMGRGLAVASLEFPTPMRKSKNLLIEFIHTNTNYLCLCLKDAAFPAIDLLGGQTCPPQFVFVSFGRGFSSNC